MKSGTQHHILELNDSHAIKYENFKIQDGGRHKLRYTKYNL